MSFKLFKPQDWWKRSAEARGRNYAVLPLLYTKRREKSTPHCIPVF